jgi:hypothetical protein
MLRLLFACVMLAGAGCTTAPAETVLPTATTLRVIQATMVPTVDRALRDITTDVPPTPDQCHPPSDQPMTRHTVSAEISYEHHRAQVEQQIDFINRSGETLSQIVLDVEPNRFGGVFTPDELTANREVAGYEVTGRRMTVDLTEPLPPNCAISLSLKFTLQVPPVGGGASGYTGYLGYTANQLNLGQWLPMVALRRGGEWVIHDVAEIGEQVVVETADWDVTLTVSDAPDTLTIAAPGTLVEQDAAAKRWHYTIEDAREFTMSLSHRYEVQAATAEGGVRVEVYTFEQGGQFDSAKQALDAATHALGVFSNLFGAYPYQRFVVVQGDFPDGMEFSGLVFVSDQWFRSNPGTAQSYLTIITVHETAHQWWYARVGGDQALDPWLDEAFAVYSEYIIYEEHYPDLKAWWWNFRVDTYVGQGFIGPDVDAGVYDFGTVREYINGVYLRGAHLLDDLRDDLGTDAFFAWLRRYAEVARNQVATADLLWSLLTPEQLAATQATREKYLGDSG